MRTGLTERAGRLKDLPPMAPVRPTLFVGLGGTGINVLGRLRRHLQEAGERWASPRFHEFLAIDTSEEELSGSYFAGPSVEPLDASDRIFIGASPAQVAHLLADSSTAGVGFNSEIHDWAMSGVTQGAGQSRIVGRLMFQTAAPRIAGAIQERLRRGLNTPWQDGKSTQDLAMDAVVVASLAGGTGSGCFLECAFLLKALGAGQLKVRIDSIRLLLVLPDVFRSVLSDRQYPRAQANGYAALRELEYYNGPDHRPVPVHSWGLVSSAVEVASEVEEPPASVVYLFSNSNGGVQHNHPEGVFETVAEALALSAGSLELSSRMRGTWANAESMSYQGALTYRLIAEHEEEGGSAEVPGSEPFVAYERHWATRYSSLGLSRITLELPRLRRLASVRLLASLVEWEIGEESELSEDSLLVLRDLESRMDVELLSPELLGSMTEHGLQRVRQIVRDSRSGREAAREAQRLIRQLGGIREGIDGAERDDLGTLADRLLANAQMRGRSAGQKLTAGWLPASAHIGLRGQQSVLRELASRSEALSAKMHGPGDIQENDPFELTSIRQWVDLDDNGHSDLMGLGAAALQIIREQLISALRRVLDREHEGLRRSLMRVFLGVFTDALNSAVDHLERQRVALVDWIELLRDQEHELVRELVSSPHAVLSLRLARDRNAMLPEIDRAIRRSAGGDTLSHAALRRQILDRYSELRQELTDTPESLSELAVGSGPASPAARVLRHLVDSCTGDLLSEFPEQNDIYFWIEKQDVGPVGLVAEVVSRAGVLWPIAPGHDLGRSAHTYLLCEADQPLQPSELHTAIRGHLKSRGCLWCSPDPESRVRPTGALTVVAEVHGYSVLNLGSLEELRSAYLRELKNTPVTVFHPDESIISALPDLKVPRDVDVRREIERLDLAMSGILLRIFHWEPEQKVFKFRHRESGAALNTRGDDHRGVANWLATPTGRELHPGIEDRVATWIRDRETGASSRAEALTCAEEVLALGLCLEQSDWSLREHRGETSPERTMVRRLAYRLVHRPLERLCARFEGLAEIIERWRHVRLQTTGSQSQWAEEVGAHEEGPWRVWVPKLRTEWSTEPKEELSGFVSRTGWLQDRRPQPDVAEPAASPREQDPASECLSVTAPGVGRSGTHEAFSSETVVTRYPAPIALAYQRFCCKKDPRARLERLVFAMESLVRYLVILGVSDLFQCLGRGGAEPDGLPARPEFGVFRESMDSTQGKWVGTLRETARALGEHSDRIVSELPGVCGPGSGLQHLIERLLGSRNKLQTHPAGFLAMSEGEAQRELRRLRPILADAFLRTAFLRRYPLGFVRRVPVPRQRECSDDGYEKYRIHSCMGARIAGSVDAYTARMKQGLHEDLPFVVTPDGSRLLYLWPLLLEREAEQLCRTSLYIFEKIPDSAGRFLSQTLSSAIDHRDGWTERHAEAGQSDHRWLYARLRDLPSVVQLDGDLTLSDALQPQRKGRLAGCQLGPYRLLQLVATGGFGSIYSAEAPDEERVAVKVLERIDLRGQLARFFQEFEKLQSIGSHPGIIRCYRTDSETIEGEDYPWYSMEFAVGGDLRRELEERRSGPVTGVPWDDPQARSESIDAFRAVAGAVAHLHRLGIVHRDVKPGNVLIMEDGTMRLSDFGLVKNLAPSSGTAALGPKTTAGDVLGTPRYMSPEQRVGKTVGKQTDVYSLGILLAELATGARPPQPPELGLEGSSGSQLSGFGKLDGLPKLFRRFILRLTDVNPERRPPDAVEVLSEFEDLLRGS